MCIPSYSDFINENPKYKKFEHSVTAKNVFDYLRELDTIENMIAANNNGKPALYGAQVHIETNYAGNPDFNLEDNFVRQCVGTMVKTILKPFGYIPSIQRDLPKKESKYFTSATHYSLDENAIVCKLVRKLTIEVIKK